MSAAIVIGELVVDVTDGTLVLGVRNGDRSAFAALYDRRARLIRAICYDETRDRDAAADLAQEVFLRAYSKLGELRDPQRFAAWLTGIARQVCREWRRSRRRQKNRIAGYASVFMKRAAERMMEQETAAPDADERLTALRGAIAGERGGLGAKERLALHAFYLQEMDVEDARAVMGMSRSGFYHVLAAACGRLREMLGVREVRS